MPHGLRDIVFAVGTQDIEGEATYPGEDAWVLPDATGIFQHRDVANIVVPVFDAPVAADGVGGFPGGDRCGTDVK